MIEKLLEENVWATLKMFDKKPYRQIVGFASKNTDEARQMFVELFDDSKGYIKRAMAFEEKAKGKFWEKL